MVHPQQKIPWNEPSFPEDMPTLLKSYRLKAWKTFQELPFPSSHDEDWRKTDLRSLNLPSLKLASKSSSDRFEGKDFESSMVPFIERLKGGEAVLTGRQIITELDPELAGKGVIFTDLISAARDFPKLVEKILGRIVAPSDGKFSALTGAYAQNGVFIYIPQGLRVDQILHSFFQAPRTKEADFTHILIYLEDGSTLTYVHETASLVESNDQALIGENVEIFVGQDANLKFIEFQNAGRHVWSFGYKQAQVNRDGKLDWVVGGIGSHLAKQFLTVDLMDCGAEGHVSGLFFANGEQHLAYNTIQNHYAPSTYSNLLFKGALADSGRSVWRGMIYVAPSAENADGYQENRNLLLSERARSTSIPGLEILNDAVRCSHGATVGKLDAEKMFYLKSRGIPHVEAKRLIVRGYFDEVLKLVPLVQIRERLEESISRKMSQGL